MKKFNITVNGNQYEVEVEEIKDGFTAPLKVEQSSPKANESVPKQAPKAQVKKIVTAAGAASIKAPMPGTINDIKASEGQSVKAGDVLIILEAMKMENEIVAPSDGTVSQVVAAKGSSVATDDVLAYLN